MLFPPLWVIKTRLFAWVLSQDDEHHIDPKAFRIAAKACYAALRQYVKEHGHFNVVEIHGSEGEEILIRL